MIVEVVYNCNDISLANILVIIKRIILLIQLIAPILLIINGTISFMKLVKNPEEKNGHKKIINQFLAASIIFFIPLFVNAGMGMLVGKNDFSTCWMNAEDTIKTSEKYYEVLEKNKHQIIPKAGDYEKGSPKGSLKGNLYGETLSIKALELACSAIGTNYLTAADAKKVGCTLSSDGRLKVPNVAQSHKYRAELPQTQNILKFWDEEKARNLGGIGWYGPASCSPWIGSLLRYMGYDSNIATAVAKNEAPVSPWTGEKITNAISAHGIGCYMYNHPESFDNIPVNSNKSIAEQCKPGDIIVNATHIMIYTGNELAQKAFPGTTGDVVEAAENGRCYPGVTNAGRGRIGSYKVFRVKKPATITK